MSKVDEKDKRQRLLSISEAAEVLGVSGDTLRRWGKNGKLNPTHLSSGGHRYYSKEQLEGVLVKDLFLKAKKWGLREKPKEPLPNFYCRDSSTFQARLSTMLSTAQQVASGTDIDIPLVIAVAGEIGNNSFDHNIGNWPDISGTFFGYDLDKRKIVLADRGQGVLKTLQQVRPQLSTHEDALHTAFTEMISGRAPETRGNGLKFVRKVITESLVGLRFQTGDAELYLEREETDLRIEEKKVPYNGCIALITF